MLFLTCKCTFVYTGFSHIYVIFIYFPEGNWHNYKKRTWLISITDLTKEIFVLKQFSVAFSACRRKEAKNIKPAIICPWLINVKCGIFSLLESLCDPRHHQLMLQDVIKYGFILDKTKKTVLKCFLCFYCNDKIQIYFQTSNFIKLFSNITGDSLENNIDPNVDN